MDLLKSEKDWQAEEDARIISQYQDILNDKKRLKVAIETAKKHAEALEKKATQTREAVAKLSDNAK